MRVLVMEPEREPYQKEIDGSLESMQEIVGGLIQALYPYEEQVCLVCNEESKINGMPLNRVLPEMGDDIIAGTFFVCGLGEGSFESVDERQMKRFKERFAEKELFMKGDNGIVVMRLPTTIVDKKWVKAKEAQTIPEKQEETKMDRQE